MSTPALSEALAPITYEYGRLPNGWPQPTFLSVDDGGGVVIEWCFGAQGAANSWRVMFSWDPDDGGMCCRTTQREHEAYAAIEGDAQKIGPALDRWLKPSLPIGTGEP